MGGHWDRREQPVESRCQAVSGGVIDKQPSPNPCMGTTRATGPQTTAGFAGGVFVLKWFGLAMMQV